MLLKCGLGRGRSTENGADGEQRGAHAGERDGQPGGGRKRPGSGGGVEGPARALVGWRV